MQLAVGVAAQPDDAVAERRAAARASRPAARRPAHDVAADDDRRVVRHLREHRLERREVAVDVVERRDGHRESADDLELEPASRLDAAGAHDRAQRAGDAGPGGRSPCRRRPRRRAAGGRASRRRPRPARRARRRARRRAGARARRAARATAYAMPCVFRSFATDSVGCAPFASQPRTFSSSSSMSDGFVLRVVAADDLDELAVARRARVGGDDAVDRVLLRADPRQPQLHCHSLTSSLSSSCACWTTCGSRSGAACRSAWQALAPAIPGERGILPDPIDLHHLRHLLAGLDQLVHLLDRGAASRRRSACAASRR